MFRLVLHFSLLTLATSTSDLAYKESLESIMPVFRTAETLNLNESCFPALENYQMGAAPVKESKYPWIARVVHSRSADIPHVCTAICIDEAIFITAARCIYTLKVTFTTVIYKQNRFKTRAFVLPSEPTKQMFDDVGFIVVKTKSGMQWTFVELFNLPNRTDEVFQWFENLEKFGEKINYKVVGYAMKKGTHLLKMAERQSNLTELDVAVSIDLCMQILAQNKRRKVFEVPCYHSCTFAEYVAKSRKCRNYHGVEGGALLDKKSNKLIGIVTWGGTHKLKELPVGFTTMNSDNFFKDYTCAKRIREDDGLLVTKGYYQNLCDEN